MAKQRQQQDQQPQDQQRRDDLDIQRDDLDQEGLGAGDQQDSQEEASGDQPPADGATEPQRLRQGSENRPICPRCSSPDEPQLMVAASTPGPYTYYQCPNDCGEPGVKVPRPEAYKQLSEYQRRQRLRRGASPNIDER